ncbi:MAG: cytochrome ubiquinol oxidase subunit I [Elusimicrobia bacterium]|jgi:cytochrome d ubiquinol oxidase subunit I|nr:cytochrome ubiquinol oxidase subunit I [Elusimicrobiota bacterium]
MDVLFLSRLQFALTIMFHYLFPPLTIGLGALMVAMEGLYLKTKNPQYEIMAKFWTKIFAVNFAMGVATGIVMEFQFGTNWANYSRFVGDVFGSALAAEGIFAFFLESGFLAILVFGWDKVSPRMHFFSTLMVFVGSVFSSVWITIANSWQQTPSGFHIVGEGAAARAEITDFWAMIFNPSSMDRLIHVWLGAFSMGGFFVMSVSAYYLLKGRHRDLAQKSFTLALFLATAASWAQLASGHHQARVVAVHQPAKLAAFEGHYQTGDGGAPLTLLGHPDAKTETTTGLKIPGLLSFMIHGNFTTPVPGLDRFKKEDRPPVALTFHAYHVMVGLGFLMIGLTGWALWARIRGRLFENRFLLWIFVFAVLAPLAANQLGWVAAEVGRQPWIVYGLLRTSDALSPVVRANQVLGSILMFGVIYALLFAVWFVVMDHKIKQGPEDVPTPPQGPGRGFIHTAGDVRSSGSLTEGKE